MLHQRDTAVKECAHFRRETYPSKQSKYLPLELLLIQPAVPFAKGPEHHCDFIGGKLVEFSGAAFSDINVGGARHAKYELRLSPEIERVPGNYDPGSDRC